MLQARFPGFSFTFIALLLLLITFSFTECRKEAVQPEAEEPAKNTSTLQRGRPPQQSVIHGYLVAGYSIGLKTYYAHSTFHDPGFRLTEEFNRIYLYSSMPLGNVNVGSLWLNGWLVDPMENGNTLTYELRRNPEPLIPICTWKIEGNKTFIEEEIPLSHGFPEVLPSAPSFTMKLGGSFSYNLNNLIGNYDSAHVGIYPVNKSLHPAAANFTFAQGEISGGTVYNCYIRASNYAYKTSANKVYVFQQTIELQKNVTVIP